MPRTCTACRHPKRAEIDGALLGGEPLRNVAKQFSLSAASLFRHKAHLPKTLAKAHEAREVARADSLVAQLNQLAADARRVQGKAEAAGDLRTALAGVRELTRLVEVATRLRAENSLSLEDAQELFGGMARLVKEHVHDPPALRAIASGFQELIERIDRRVAQV